MSKQYDPHKLTLDLPPETEDIGTEPSFIKASPLQAVEVQTVAVAERQRQISAKVQIPHSVDQVWQVLTDYVALAEFIPNLAKSSLLKHPTGGIRLEQVGTQRLLNFNFSARVVLDLEEEFPHKISFKMVEGDFKAFSGSWCLEPYSLANQNGTSLSYTLHVWPKRTIPIGIIERRLCNDLRFNLLAIRQRMNELSGTPK